MNPRILNVISITSLLLIVGNSHAAFAMGKKKMAPTSEKTGAMATQVQGPATTSSVNPYQPLNAQVASDVWAHGCTSSNGTIWSDFLPNSYDPNCISITVDNVAQCELPPKDGEIVDSDASRACHAVGGEMPTAEDLGHLCSGAQLSIAQDALPFPGFVMTSTLTTSDPTSHDLGPMYKGIVSVSHYDNSGDPYSNNRGPTLYYDDKVIYAPWAGGNVPIRCVRHVKKN